MKKKLIYAGLLLLGMAAATGCSNEEGLEQVMNNGKTFEAVIENVEARTSVSDDYKVLWTEGDKFDIWNGATKAGILELKSGAGSTSGAFGVPEGEEAFEVAEGMTAFFPTTESTSKSYTFVTSYSSQETDAPMLGTFTNGKFSFSLLTAMVRVVVTDVSAGNATLTITAADNLMLTGNAALNAQNTLDEPTGGTNSVTVTVNNQTEGATLTFDVPVPAQTYTDGLSVKLTTGDNNTEVFSKKTNEFTASTGKIYVFGAKTVSVDSEEDLTATIQGLLTGGYSVTLEGEATKVSVSSLSVPTNTTATLNLNGKTLSLGETASTMSLGRSASTTHGIVNHGTLSINGGKIVYTNNENINTTAIYNYGNITLTDVTVESNVRCFVNKGTWNDSYKSLAEHGTEPSTVATITDCKFTSSLTDHLTEGKHIYAVHGLYYSKMTMKNTEVSGNGGITVDCSYAELNKVKATHNCTTGAHDLYVACGNATFDSECVFNNAYAYSDDTYGNAVVNGKEYTTSGVISGYTTVSDADGLTTAIADGGNIALSADVTLSSTLTVSTEATLDLNGKTLTINNEQIAKGLINQSKLTILNGTIDFTGDGSNGAAVCNKGQIELQNVNITSNTVCFRNYGDESKTNLDGLNAEDATVTAVINGGTFNSTFCNNASHTQHRYAVHGYFYSNLIMSNCSIKGSGGVDVDVSFATLNNVDATHACQYGAHDLYVPCGNATVTNCTFTNAAAYSDATYGNAVVNGTTYEHDTANGANGTTKAITFN